MSFEPDYTPARCVRRPSLVALMSIGKVDTVAWEVAENVVQGTGDALLEGNYEAFASFFNLPFWVETTMGKIEIKSHDEHREIFHRVQWQYRGMGVTHFRRELLAAYFFDSGQILSVHTSELLSGKTSVQDPFKVLTTLQKIDNTWLITDNRYAINNSVGLNRALYGPRPSEDELNGNGSGDLLPLK